MARRIVPIALPLVAALGLWLAGRAPTQYVLAEECRRFQEERRVEWGRRTLALAPLEESEPKSPELARLRRERDAALRAPKVFFLRGWRVTLLPATAPKPAPDGDRVALALDPSRRGDPPPLRGTMEAWLRPEGLLARLFG